MKTTLLLTALLLSASIAAAHAECHQVCTKSGNTTYCHQVCTGWPGTGSNDNR